MGAGRRLEVQLRWKVSAGGRWGLGGCRGIALGMEHPRGDRASPHTLPAPRPHGGGRQMGECWGTASP